MLSSLFTSEISSEYQENSHALALLGDSLAVLKKIQPKSVHLIFADAPYNIGKDFGNNKNVWESVAHYIEWCKQWINECMRVLVDNGTLYLMTATHALSGRFCS